MLALMPGASNGWYERLPMAAEEECSSHLDTISPSNAIDIADVYLPLPLRLQK